MLDRQSTISNETDRIMRDPNFQALVKERTGFAWAMSAIMLAVYLGFVFMAAFGKEAMGAPVGDTAISWGILLGLFTIVFAFVLTGIYVSRANGRFDELTARLGRDPTR